MEQTFDVSRYLLPFRVSAPLGILMATSLERRVPSDAPEAVQRAVDRMRGVCAKVHTEWKSRNRTKRSGDLRNELSAFAAAWNALHGRIFAWTKFDVDECPESAEAAVLLAEVFSESLRFLRGDPGQQWLASDHKIELVVSEAHREVFVRLAGAFFVTRVQRAHQSLGAALGMLGDVPHETPSGDLRPLLRELVQAVRGYALQVVAAADLDNPADIARITHQLAPVETHRLRGEPREDTSDVAPTDDEAKPTDGGLTERQPANDAKPAEGRRRVA